MINFEITPEQYYNAPYNHTIQNERCVELLLAFRFIDFHQSNIFEIGAVSPYYKKTGHSVIDPTDKKASIQAFSQDIEINDKNILSISTIEHMGIGDYGLPKKKIMLQYKN
jgi:hypothetical protein